MGLFANIKNQRGTQGGVYFTPGLYVAKINRVKLGETRKKEDFFVVECEIVESDSDERKPGSTVSWMVMFKHDAALGNIADFIRAGLWAYAVQNEQEPAAEDFNDIEIDEESADEVTSEDNPFAGLLMKVEATNIKTRAGKDFTVVKWTPPTAEELAALDG